MNNFDENKEFVRRPSAQQTTPRAPQQPARPQTRPAGSPQRPAQSARPQARPAPSVQRQAQMPSQMRSAQQKRPTRPAPAPQRERISPDGQLLTHNGGSIYPNTGCMMVDEPGLPYYGEEADIRRFNQVRDITSKTRNTGADDKIHFLFGRVC